MPALARSATIASFDVPNPSSAIFNQHTRVSFPSPPESSSSCLGGSQPVESSAPVTPPRYTSYSQPTADTSHKIIYNRGRNRQFVHHILPLRPAPPPHRPQPPIPRPLGFNTLGFRREPNSPRRSPSPLFPEFSFNRRPPVVPKGSFASNSGDPIPRDYAYADLNPIRPDEPDDPTEKKAGPSVPPRPTAIQPFSGRPRAIVNPDGTIANGEDVFKWEYRPSVPISEDSKEYQEWRATCVPTPIVTPNGSFTYPDDSPGTNPERQEVDSPGRMTPQRSQIHLNFTRALERLASERGGRDSDSPRGDSSQTILLRSAFGAGSPLTSFASSSHSLDISPCDEPQASPPEQPVPAGSSSNDNNDTVHHRYCLRRRPRPVPPPSTQTPRAPPTRPGRNQSQTLNTSPPTRIKENVNDDSAPSPVLDHPHAPRPTNSKRASSSLKRRHDDGGTTQVDVAQESSDGVPMRITRSRARKSPRIEE